MVRQTLPVPLTAHFDWAATPLPAALLGVRNGSSLLFLWKSFLGEWRPLCPKDEPGPSCWQLTGNDWVQKGQPLWHSLGSNLGAIHAPEDTPSPLLWDQAVASLWLKPHPS